MDTMTQTPEETPTPKRPGFINRHKKGLSIAAAVLVVGGIGSAVTGGPKGTPTTEQVDAQPEPQPEPAPEVTPETAPEDAVVDPAPAEEYMPDTSVPPNSDTGVTPPTGTELPLPPAGFTAADFDLPQNYDDAFMEVVIDSSPYGVLADPVATVDTAMETCAHVANGGKASDMEAVAVALYYDQPEMLKVAQTAIYAGIGFYCNDLAE